MDPNRKIIQLYEFTIKWNPSKLSESTLSLIGQKIIILEHKYPYEYNSMLPVFNKNDEIVGV